MSESKNSEVSRRSLLTGSAAGLALASLPEWFAREAVAAERAYTASAPRRIGPNDTIVFGAIGMGGSKGGFHQGLNITKAAARQKGTKVVAVCDVDAVHREEAAKAFGPDTKQYHDFRELLARPDIDAVTIGVPDHWHAIIAIAAMRAGKDVYCEKPLTLTIEEGKALVRVARETKRVFQTGSQQRSNARFRMACELVRNGRVGRLKQVRAQIPGAPKGGPFPVQPVPEGFDWDMWQGPAFATDYVKERTHGNFRYWYEYAGGMVTDWGAHHNDIAQWALGMDHSGPSRVQAVGTAPQQGPTHYNVHTEYDITYSYPNDVTLVCTNKGENGVRFEGERGWIFVSRSKIEASDQKLLDEPLARGAVRLYVSNDHMGNFVDCVRSRETPICPASVGHRSVSVCHLANISLRLGGRKLDWDPRREQFRNDPEANLMLGRPMRAPWRL